MDKLNVTFVTNLESCRLEAEISDENNELVAVVYEDALGWHIEQTAGTRARVPDGLIDKVKSDMQRYINRSGAGAPEATTRGELSLWLMLKDDGTAMGVPYGSLHWVPVAQVDQPKDVGRRVAGGKGSVVGRLRRWWTSYRVITLVVMIPIPLYCAITKRLFVAETCILVPLCMILAWGSYSLLKNLSNSK